MYKAKSMEEGRPFPDYTTLAIAAIAIIGGILVFRMGFSHPASSTQNGSQNAPIELAQTTQEIKPGVDTIFSLGETHMYMPTGATHQMGYVSMILREPNLYASTGDPGWTRPFVINYEYQTYPGLPASGISFFKPVLICFQLNQELWQDYVRRADAYQVEYYAESLFGSRWIVLPRSEKTERLQLCGETHHLSLYSLAIRPEEGVPLPLIPITGANYQAPEFYPTELYPTELPPTRTHDQLSVPWIPTSIVHTPVPPTTNPTAIPPTSVPTAIPPTVVPTEIVPTDVPTEIATSEQPTTVSEPSEQPTIESEPSEQPTTESEPPEQPTTESDPPEQQPTNPESPAQPTTDPASEILLVHSWAALILMAF